MWGIFKPGKSRSIYVILLFLSCMILRGQSFREFPIIGYCGEDFLISDTDFSRLREAGFNACLCYYPNMATAKRALDNAKPHDVGLILYVPEVRSDAHILLDSLGNHTNLLAFFLYDEPRMGQKESTGPARQQQTGIKPPNFCLCPGSKCLHLLPIVSFFLLLRNH